MLVIEVAHGAAAQESLVEHHVLGITSKQVESQALREAVAELVEDNGQDRIEHVTLYRV